MVSDATAMAVGRDLVGPLPFEKRNWTVSINYNGWTPPVAFASGRRFDNKV